MRNKEIRLASRPTGMPTTGNFKIEEANVPEPGDGELLLRMLYISVDPYLRGRMREGRSYVPPFQLDEVIASGGVGEVVTSKASDFKPGDIVSGQFGWRLFNVARAGQVMKVDPAFPVTTALGVLGMPGLTAYFGLLDIGQPKPAETVVVSGAAGAVGMTVCQIARIKGCRVVGIAGGEKKRRYLLDELGVHAAIDYHQANISEQLNDACREGVDVYFDNVGGEVSDAVLPLIRNGARIVICGQISIYNLDKPDIGRRPQTYLLINSALMKGFIITAYLPRAAEGIRDLRQWLTEGKLKYRETIMEGFENAPEAFTGLFTGANLGKQLVKVSAQ